MSFQRYLKRQIDRTPSFELGTAGVPDDRGSATAKADGREYGRDGVKTVLGQPVQAGATVIMLAGGDSDRAAVLGVAPFVGG